MGGGTSMLSDLGPAPEASNRRPLKGLCIQRGFHKAYPDVSTLATTYNDRIYKAFVL